MNPQILNRESTAPRKPTWQQIEATGEHHAMLGDEPIVQVLDAEAIRPARRWALSTSSKTATNR